jgi:formylglycine-generating enzyme required for sulfatase activity/DNA-binding winged helix-turn-helix (wHTH) protein
MAFEYKQIYRFADFILDPTERRLKQGSDEVYLPPKTFETLLFLVERHGHLVTKSDLLDTLWADSFVTENVLAQRIKELREALGDDAYKPRYIKTVQRLGYRFIAEVQKVAENGDAIEEEYMALKVVVTEEDDGPAVIGTRAETPKVSSDSMFSIEPVRKLSRSERLSPALAMLKWQRKGLLGVAALIVAATAGWFLLHGANVRWAKRQIPRVEELTQGQKTFEAYDLAMQVRNYLPADPTLTRLMPLVSDTFSLKTEPAGAQVYLRRFAPDQSGNSPPRQLVGTSPVVNHEIARGDYILYIEKDGYVNVERTISASLLQDGRGVAIPPPIRIEAKLMEPGKAPDQMVLVSGGDYRIVAWRRPTDARVRLDDYFIDKFEVTNREYKEFVNAGGYQKKQFWKYPFFKEGNSLSWEEAMREFKDHTGLQGPRSWSNQNYPDGNAQHPVTGVCWYEAAAYAEFRSKRLPNIFQWEKAARNGAATFAGITMPWGILTATTDYRANFRGIGPMPVDSLEFGISPYGCYNMAGNVSEWCLNDTTRGFITSGGSWEDPPYLFGQYGTYPGFYSSNKLGFRCVLNLPDSTNDQGAMRIDLNDEVPVYTPASDASVNEWFKYYQYDRTPLDSQIVEVKETAEWRRETITYNGAQGERVTAYLYLPNNYKRPLQVIHLMPAADVTSRYRTLSDSIELQFEPLVKSGRALFAVTLRGFIGRDWPPGHVDPAPSTAEFREEIANLTIDERRGLDYLETRDDIDISKLGYFGPSGGTAKLIVTAVEPRYRSIVLTGAGAKKYQVQYIAEANPLNFAPQIRAPKLMLHGRYDEADPLKTEAEPLFKLLREPKRLVVYEGGHIPDLSVLMHSLNDWFDETLGRVRQE